MLKLRQMLSTLPLIAASLMAATSPATGHARERDCADLKVSLIKDLARLRPELQRRKKAHVLLASQVLEAILETRFSPDASADDMANIRSLGQAVLSTANQRSLDCDIWPDSLGLTCRLPSTKNLHAQAVFFLNRISRSPEIEITTRSHGYDVSVHIPENEVIRDFNVYTGYSFKLNGFPEEARKTQLDDWTSYRYGQPQALLPGHEAESGYGKHIPVDVEAFFSKEPVIHDTAHQETFRNILRYWPECSNEYGAGKYGKTGG